MADLKNIEMMLKGERIGVALQGKFEAGERNFAGLIGIQWDQVNPEKFINSVVTLRGTYADGSEGMFINDMRMTRIKGGTAGFEA